jgi:hypothetical protein
MLPETPWNWPRTLLTIRWRAVNATLVCAGSSCQSPGSGISMPWMLRTSVWLIVVPPFRDLGTLLRPETVA